MWAVFSLYIEAIFSVCCRGYFWSAPPPLTIYLLEPLELSQFFLLHRYLYFFQIVEVFEICGYEADRCHAYLKKLFTYMYRFKLFHCYCELNTGVAVGFVGYIMAAVSNGGGHIK